MAETQAGMTAAAEMFDRARFMEAFGSNPYARAAAASPEGRKIFLQRMEQDVMGGVPEREKISIAEEMRTKELWEKREEDLRRERVATREADIQRRHELLKQERAVDLERLLEREKEERAKESRQTPIQESLLWLQNWRSEMGNLDPQLKDIPQEHRQNLEALLKAKAEKWNLEQKAKEEATRKAAEPGAFQRWYRETVPKIRKGLGMPEGLPGLLRRTPELGISEFLTERFAPSPPLTGPIGPPTGEKLPVADWIKKLVERQPLLPELRGRERFMKRTEEEDARFNEIQRMMEGWQEEKRLRDWLEEIGIERRKRERQWGKPYPHAGQ